MTAATNVKKIENEIILVQSSIDGMWYMKKKYANMFDKTIF